MTDRVTARRSPRARRPVVLRLRGQGSSSHTALVWHWPGTGLLRADQQPGNGGENFRVLLNQQRFPQRKYSNIVQPDRWSRELLLSLTACRAVSPIKHRAPAVPAWNEKFHCSLLSVQTRRLSTGGRGSMFRQEGRKAADCILLDCPPLGLSCVSLWD